MRKVYNMKQQNKFQLNLTDNYRVVPESEITYCNAETFFPQMDDCNARAQKALDEINNFGKGSL